MKTFWTLMSMIFSFLCIVGMMGYYFDGEKKLVGKIKRGDKIMGVNLDGVLKSHKIKHTNVEERLREMATIAVKSIKYNYRNGHPFSVINEAYRPLIMAAEKSELQGFQKTANQIIRINRKLGYLCGFRAKL